MTRTSEARAGAPRAGAGAHTSLPWNLWRHQTFEIIRIELRKILYSRRAALVYLLAFTPPALFALVTAWLRIYTPRDFDPHAMGEMPLDFAAIYQGLILRAVVFFGCAWVFMNLFRGEIIDRSLHYYFLAPVRRELVVWAKFLAGLLAAGACFSLTATSSVLIFFLAKDAEVVRDYLMTGGGSAQLAGYFAVTWLACAGYGALFLVIGLLFRNPVLPALALYGWEAINFLLPPALKRTSVIYYLQSLLPLKPPEGAFAFVADPSSPVAAVAGLLLFVVVLLVAAMLRIRRTEVAYGGE